MLQRCSPLPDWPLHCSGIRPWKDDSRFTKGLFSFAFSRHCDHSHQSSINSAKAGYISAGTVNSVWFCDIHNLHGLIPSEEWSSFACNMGQKDLAAWFWLVCGHPETLTKQTDWSNNLIYRPSLHQSFNLPIRFNCLTNILMKNISNSCNKCQDCIENIS